MYDTEKYAKILKRYIITTGDFTIRFAYHKVPLNLQSVMVWMKKKPRLQGFCMILQKKLIMLFNLK